MPNIRTKKSDRKQKSFPLVPRKADSTSIGKKNAVTSNKNTNTYAPPNVAAKNVPKKSEKYTNMVSDYAPRTRNVVNAASGTDKGWSDGNVVMSPITSNDTGSVGASTLEASTMDASTMDASTMGGSTMGGSTMGGSTMGASTMGASTIDTRYGNSADMSTVYGSESGTDVSPHRRPPASYLKGNSPDSAGGIFRVEEMADWAHDEYNRINQKVGVLSIIISSAQLLILTLQLSMCGVAPLDVNPMVGPYPDAISEWGGKNAYLTVEEFQLWRFVTPNFLHVGVLHLMVNVAIQLEAAANFEREWGSFTFLFLYLISGVGCIVSSCVFDADTYAVGSSGALMGLFGAKFAQITCNTAFEVEAPHDKGVKLSHVTGLFCMFAVLFCFSFITYIDWSGHVGGLAAGYFAGMMFFSRPIISTCERILWGGIGWILFMGFFIGAFYWLFTEVESDSDLADPCSYFRTLFAEGYDCECLWD